MLCVVVGHYRIIGTSEIHSLLQGEIKREAMQPLKKPTAKLPHILFCPTATAPIEITSTLIPFAFAFLFS